MEYVYSDLGQLSYEMDNEKVYVKDVYDTSDKSITLDIPDQKTVIMYLS